MKYTLIGTILLDRIINVDGTQSDGFGGLMYAINAFRASCNEGDEIIPVSRIGNDAYIKVKDYFKDDPNVNLDGLQYVNAPNNRVNLIYRDKNERAEYSLNPMEPLELENVQPFLNTNIVIVNFISGWDISNETLKKIRHLYSGPIYMDIHSLTLNRKKSGERVHKQVNDIDRWIEGIDFIQSNQEELKRISPFDNLKAFNKSNSLSKNMIYNLTRGEMGSETSFYIDKKLELIKGKPCTAVDVVDPTGCGDAFASGFITDYFTANDAVSAVKNANMMAACMGSFHGLPSAKSLKTKFDEIKGRA